MTSRYQRAKRAAQWRGAAIAITLVLIFCFLQGMADNLTN